MQIRSFPARGLLAAIVLSALLPRAAQAETSAAPAVKAQYGEWGFDLTGVDSATKPGDDFFRYANGAWVDRTEIPADKPAYSLRYIMSDITEQRLHEIMESAAVNAGREPSTLAGKVGAFYHSFMDEPRLAQLGAAPLAGHLADIRAADTREKIAVLMGRTNADFEGAVFGFSLDIDLKDPARYAVYLGQAGLGLPDRDYYLEPSFAEKKARYETHVATLLRLLAWPEPEARAKDVLAFESQIAAASWTKTEQRNLDAIYNPMSVAELEAFAPGFPWRPFLGAADLGARSRLIIAEKSAFPKIAGIFAATPLATLQAYLAFTVADNAAPYLSPPFASAFFELRKKVLSGQQQESARWKLGVHAVGGGDYGAGDRFDRFGNLGWAVGELFTARYFPPAAKEKIEVLVANVRPPTAPASNASTG